MRKIHIVNLLILFCLGSLSGCAHSVHQVYHADHVPTQGREVASRGKPIEAQGEQFVILSLVGNTDYVDQAYEKLLRQCPRGEIRGINTRYSTSLGFLSFWNRVRIQGVCMEGPETESQII